jgi:hypothetical protein
MRPDPAMRSDSSGPLLERLTGKRSKRSWLANANLFRESAPDTSERTAPPPPPPTPRCRGWGVFCVLGYKPERAAGERGAAGGLRARGGRGPRGLLLRPPLVPPRQGDLQGLSQRRASRGELQGLELYPRQFNRSSSISASYHALVDSAVPRSLTTAQAVQTTVARRQLAVLAPRLSRQL